MKKVFCTISTHSHLFKCFALAESLQAFDGILEVLLVDQKDEVLETPSNVRFTFLKDLESDLAKRIIKKYVNKTDRLRWSLKSVFILQLLAANNKVIYIDNDILFFSDPSFLFEELSQHPVLLTPHHYPSNPESNQNWFEANFRVGLYNAGFLAANQDAIAVLNWWAKACLYRCEKSYWRGLFDDQKYLDLFPILENRTKVLTHLGCNVAAWNEACCRVSLQENLFVVNEHIPLIFYHFNGFSLQQLEVDGALLQHYFNALKTYNSRLELKNLIPSPSMLDKGKLLFWKLLNKFNVQ